MERLNPALALVHYEELQNRKKGSPISVEPVAEENCIPRCSLSDPDEWTIYSHMRNKGPAADVHVQLVLRLEPGEEDGEAYQVYAVSRGDGTNEAWTPFPANDVWYYIPPWGSDSVTSAGRQEIVIQSVNRPRERRTVQLCILPSGMDDENYRLMLERIAQLHQKLLDTSTGTVAVGARWKNVAKDLQSDIKQMGQILRQLEAAPDRDLVAVQSRVPVYKVKKMTAKAVIDREAGRRLVRTSLHDDSLEIYEHRMIRAYLEKLRRQTQLYQEAEKEERTDLAGEEIDSEKLKIAHSRLRKRLEQMREPPASERNDCSEVRFLMTGIPNVQRCQNGYAISCFPVKKRDEDRWSPVFQPTDNDNTGGRFNRLFLPSSCGVWQTWFLLYCMRELARFWAKKNHSTREEIIFHMSCAESSMEVSTTGWNRYQIVIYYLHSMTLPDGSSIQFSDISKKHETIQDVEALIKDIEEGEFPRFYDEDNLFYSVSLLNRKACRNTLLNGYCDWERITGQIDQLLASPILRGRPRQGEQLHASNLFTHHAVYRRAYTLMRQRREQLDAIDLWRGNPLPVGATHLVYEFWCLLEMLSIWEDYGFTLKSHTPNTLIAQLLQHIENEYTKVGPIQLEKESGALQGMKLELEYNRTFKFLENGKTAELRPDYTLTVFYGGKCLRFFLDAKYHNFSREQMGLWNWYWDLYKVALYTYILRLGKETRLHDDEDENVTVTTCGSYILHADVHEHRTLSGWDPRRFFWYKSDTEQSNLDRVSRSALEGVREDIGKRTGKQLSQKALRNIPKQRSGMCPTILEYDPTEHRDEEQSRSEEENWNKVNSLRFGSGCFTPETSAGFRALMQMIMEHFLGGAFPEVYRTKCWICGSEDLDCKEMSTIGGNEKYHIRCRNADCGQFWVQTLCAGCGRLLGKHWENYYRIKPGTDWNVICPHCDYRL